MLLKFMSWGCTWLRSAAVQPWSLLQCWVEPWVTLGCYRCWPLQGDWRLDNSGEFDWDWLQYWGQLQKWLEILWQVTDCWSPCTVGMYRSAADWLLVLWCSCGGHLAVWFKGGEFWAIHLQKSLTFSFVYQSTAVIKEQGKCTMVELYSTMHF